MTLFRRPKGEFPVQRANNGPDAFLKTTRAELRSPASRLDALAHLGRGGYMFVATRDEIDRMNPALGPDLPDSPYPHLYEPNFLAEIARCAIASDMFSAMESIAAAAGATIYLFPPAATDVLSQLTPARPDFTNVRIDEITDRFMNSPNCPPEYKRGGVRSAILIVRGYSLEARAASGRDVYYWFWRQAQ